MNHFEHIVRSNWIYLILWIIALILLKYGVLSFILSKVTTNKKMRELIDGSITFVLLLVIFFLHKQHIPLSNGHVLMNILYWVVGVVLYYVVLIGIGETLGHTKSQNQSQIETIHQHVPFFLAWVTTGLLAPVFEEVIFRVYIQHFLFNNTILALVISSILFALMHVIKEISTPMFLTYFGASIVVGAVYQLTGGLLYSSLLHITVNTLAVVLMYVKKEK